MTHTSDVVKSIGKGIHKCPNHDENIQNGREWMLLKLDEVMFKLWDMKTQLEKVVHELKVHVVEDERSN